MSAFLGLIDAVVAALDAGGALTDGGIRRGRAVPVPTSKTAAIDVHLQRSQADTSHLDGSALRWETLIGIDLYTRAAAGIDGESAVDALLAAALGRLTAATPPAGVTAWSLDPSIAWDVVEADQTLVQASLGLRVQHFTTPALAALTA